MAKNPNYGNFPNDRCKDPECRKRIGHQHVMYHCCKECNYNTHLCGGCGYSLRHGQGSCEECSTL